MAEPSTSKEKASDGGADLWTRLDVPPPAAVSLRDQLHGLSTINYNDEELPIAGVEVFKQFQDHVYALWWKGTVITCIIAVAFPTLHLSPLLSILAVVVGLSLTRKQVESSRRDHIWDIERRRGTEEKSAYESVEWMNYVLRTVWPILDPDLFVAGVDLLEDSMKTLSPAIVRTVRISGVEQGSNAMRITGLRRLPADFDITTPITAEEADKKPGSSQFSTWDAPVYDHNEYINLEARFAYRRLPRPATKGSNAHFIVRMGFGLKKVAKAEVPVWTELKAVTGTIRLRLEMIPEPPFVRHVKFCFVQRPKVEIVAKPLGLLDVMSLPLVTSFVSASINTVLDYFVSPSSYTIDLSRFFLGSDVALKTKTIGVVALVVHRASHLAAADLNGKADPYFTLSFSHVGKTLYASKVVSGELNPAWEETAFVRIETEGLDEGDSIRIQVLDHDRLSRPDPMGSVIVHLRHLFDKRGVWQHYDELLETPKGGKATTGGQLSYSAAFFAVASVSSPPPLPPTETGEPPEAPPPPPTPTPKPKSSSKSTKLPYAARSKPEEDSRSAAYAQRMREMLDGRAPASPEERTGVLAVQIHQCAELVCRGGYTGKKERDPPSSYVSLFLNDEKVFQTRVKPLSSAPYINAATEVLVRDWTTSRVDFAVMDYRDRDHDVLIGFISLDLNELLSARSQITKWLPIVGGDGHGRLRFSILFKPLEIDMPPPLLDWGVGVLDIISARVTGLSGSLTAKLSFEVEGGHTESTGSTEADESSHALAWDLDQPISLPVLSRQPPIFVHLHSVHSITRNVQVGATALWLWTISGDESDISLDLPLVSSAEARKPPPALLPSAPTARQKSKKKDRETEYQEQFKVADEGALPADTPILHLTCRWKNGLGPAHREVILAALAPQRAAYQLALHRLEQAEKEDDASDGDGEHDTTATAGEEWEDATGSKGLPPLAHVSRKMKRVKQQGSTMKWIGHGVRLASKKVTRRRNVKGPEPEQEIQSAL